MTYQLIYSSVSSIPMQREELKAMLDQAQRSNRAKGITGALVYVDGWFLQVLEGDEDNLQALMNKISSDLRHETITVLQSGEVAAASFPDWNMAYVSATAKQVAHWVGLSATTPLPELFDDMRYDRDRAARVTKSILSVLMGEPALQTRDD